MHMKKSLLAFFAVAYSLATFAGKPALPVSISPAVRSELDSLQTRNRLPEERLTQLGMQ